MMKVTKASKRKALKSNVISILKKMAILNKRLTVQINALRKLDGKEFIEFNLEDL